jgi:hypothetical protein
MHVLHYLRKHTDVRLTYQGKSGSPTLVSYVDADWANDPNDPKSISGQVHLLSGDAITWASHKQKIVAQFSTEAEYIAAATTTNEILWLRQLLSEIDHTQTSPTTLLTDNQGSIAIAQNPVCPKTTKHIGMRFHHICHCYESGIIHPTYIPTGDQVADVLTKALPVRRRY